MARSMLALLLVLTSCTAPVMQESNTELSNAAPKPPGVARKATRLTNAAVAEREVLLAQQMLLSRSPDSAERAAVLYQTAAKKGSAVAEYNLGLLNEEGLGVSVDRTKAISWFRRAVANRDPAVRKLASARLANLIAKPPQETAGE